MIVQATNTGGDLGSNQFDIAMPGGGVGIYNGCTDEWGAPTNGWGAQYGGITSDSDCSTFPAALQPGCNWRFGWFDGADNPTVDFEQVTCPAAITAKTGCVRDGETPTGASSVGTESETSAATSSAAASSAAESSTVAATTTSASTAEVVVASSSSVAASSSSEAAAIASSSASEAVSVAPSSSAATSAASYAPVSSAAPTSTSSDAASSSSSDAAPVAASSSSSISSAAEEAPSCAVEYVYEYDL